MKSFSPFLGIILLFTSLVAQEAQQKLDLEFKSLTYKNESIPTLSIDLSSTELHRLDFIVAYANNYFEQDQPFSSAQAKEHIYLGFNYRF